MGCHRFPARPISHVELELTPSVAPYSAISPARVFCSSFVKFWCEETFWPTKPSHAKDLMLNTWSVHRRAKSSMYWDLFKDLILHCLCTITRSSHFSMSRWGTTYLHKNSEISLISKSGMCLNAWLKHALWSITIGYLPFWDAFINASCKSLTARSWTSS